MNSLIRNKIGRHHRGRDGRHRRRPGGQRFGLQGHSRSHDRTARNRRDASPGIRSASSAKSPAIMTCDGATYFKADGSGSRPTTSPDFLPLQRAVRIPARRRHDCHPRDRRVEHHRRQSRQRRGDRLSNNCGGTGAWAGATGYFFVSGFNRNGRVETTVSGEILPSLTQ